MSYAIIRKLLEIRLNAVEPGFKTIFENAPGKPAIGTPHQRATLMPADTDGPTMPAGGLKRESGYLQVDLYFPENAGPSAAMAKAEAIRTQFPRGLVLVESPVRLWLVKETSLSRGRNEGGFYQLSVFVYYQADVNGP